MPKVFVTRQVAQEALDLLNKHAEVDVWEKEDTPPRVEFARHIADVDGIVLWGNDDIDGPLMDAAPKLKVIADIAVGYNNIDVEAATKRGIRVSNTPGVVTNATADLTFALLLAGARRLVEMANLVHKKDGWKMWGPLEMLGTEVSGKTLGIIGMGRIGAAVARRAKGFDMRVIYHDVVRHPDEAKLGIEYVKDIPTLLDMADFVTLHVFLSKETKHLIGAKELALMKPSAILVNASRGPVVNQKALYQALKTKQIAGAALDVTEVEPIPYDDPLLALDNVIVLPHIGTQTLETGIKMSVLATQNAIAALTGEPMPTCVNCHLIGSRKR